MIDVWGIHYNGQKVIVDDESIVLDMIKQIELGEEIKVYKYKVNKEDYEALPEFKGY